MVFSSVVFLFYFLPAVLLLYYTVGWCSIRLRNALLLAASLLFYAWGEPSRLPLLLGSCLLNWLFALGLSRGGALKKLCLAAACAANLGVLFVFKYWDFAADAVNSVLPGADIPLLYIPLPIGISFFTFQAMSYVIDVYRGDVPVQKNPFYVALYITLFPQLVAGPIVRYRTVEQQILGRAHTWGAFSAGCVRFVQGLTKKLLLANSFAIVADNVFDLSLAGHTMLKIPVTLAWLGSFAYTLQIFFDFSAYSDMAIGLGKMFGFTFEENFNYPYISRSVGEFWRRWHISLSTWFREYVYFPLGGSRVHNKDIVVRNLFIVWLLTGVWHGAAWTFVFWGLLNFLFLLLERLFQLEALPPRHNWWRHIYTMLAVNFGWVLFRCESFYHLSEYIGNMFGVYGNGFFSPMVPMFLWEYAPFWAAGLLLCAPVAGRLRQKAEAGPAWVMNGLYPAGLCGLFGLCVLYIARSGYNPFIYFNF